MYRELIDGNCLSDKIEDKEIFPTGGTFYGRLNEYMFVDADTFQPFFEKIAHNQALLKENEAFEKWFSKLKTGLDYSLFCHMYAFNAVMKMVFPDAKKNVSARVGFYDTKGKRRLSEAVAGGKCACTEFAILAQLYFQSQNFPTRYVGGELAPNGDFEATQPHSFIVFQDKDKKYVFDPVNLLPRHLPRIAEFIGKPDNAYLETKCLFNGDKWFYAGGHMGEFLQNLPVKKALIETLDKGSKKVSSQLKKDKTNV